MKGLVKIGPWGGRGGHKRDIVATGGFAPHRLESVVIRCASAVDAISFTYAGIDGTSISTRRWGGPGGRKHEVRFGDTEIVMEISGTHGPFAGHDDVVMLLTFVTNAGKHGPFG